MDIQYRKLNKSDYKTLEGIACKAWKYDHDVDRTTALQDYENAVMYSYLACSNYGEAAVIDGKLVGFLLGRCNKLPHLRQKVHFTCAYALAKLALLGRKSGMSGIRIMDITKKVNRKLIRDHVHDFDGELCLFAVVPEYQKHGIGIMLIEHFHEWMRKSGAENYFLYTDTYCNIGFYESMGYELVALDTVDFGEDDENQPPKYLLYTYDLTHKRPPHEMEAADIWRSALPK